VTLEIIGVGFGRTGTASLYTALNQLGFPCYHMFEVIRNKQNRTHLDFWFRVANSEPGAQHDWEQVFAKYTAAVDNPACVVWRELWATYPDAKFVLTLHPKGAEVWYESTMQTIYAPMLMWQFKLLEILTPFGWKFGGMCRKLIWQRGHQNTMGDRGKAVEYYKRHVETIKAALPPERLLVFSADQGWRPLCDFLGVPVPASAFPNINDRVEFQKIKHSMAIGAYGILGLAIAAAAGIVYEALRFLS
jgi:sulfotransferase family protein